MATRNEWDEWQCHSKENWNDAYNNKRDRKHKNVNTNDDVDTPHFDDRVAHNNMHWACAHSFTVLDHHTHIHGSGLNLAPFTPFPCHTREWLFLFDSTYSTLYFPAFFLSVFLFSPSSTSATSSSRSWTGRSWKACATPLTTAVRTITTSSTSTQLLHTCFQTCDLLVNLGHWSSHSLTSRGASPLLCAATVVQLVPSRLSRAWLVPPWHGLLLGAGLPPMHVCPWWACCSSSLSSMFELKAAELGFRAGLADACTWQSSVTAWSSTCSFPSPTGFHCFDIASFCRAVTSTNGGLWRLVQIAVIVLHSGASPRLPLLRDVTSVVVVCCVRWIRETWGRKKCRPISWFWIRTLLDNRDK